MTFTKKDFKAMQTPGLEERMEVIQTQIQPKFREIGESLATYLSAKTGTDMFLHIARHARRSVNPPDSTWLAVANSKRGYKKHPHFQVGIWDDYVFIWLAYIYETENRQIVVHNFLENLSLLEKLPINFSISPDHTEKPTSLIQNTDLKKILERFRDVKKGEFMVGRIFKPGDSALKDDATFTNELEKTIDLLLPFYDMSFEMQEI
ncbi:DUF1054 domain-containing protein [Listeria rocourtiae]|uniref:YktB family protein n=1 Tax=Listeria rocourtiae TaxID=647910 RepID=UPI001624783E|nr:DUF1054 domain-containing protein [Listeria rocourtiae]MBC1436260.1 DUF1054 domain-containing protein [Listeria rocourtiae]